MAQPEKRSLLDNITMAAGSTCLLLGKDWLG